MRIYPKSFTQNLSFFKKAFIVFLVLWLAVRVTVAQTATERFLTPAPSVDNGRLVGVIAVQTVVYSATMFFLHKLWYKKYSNGKFHFFNDNREWLQMDKAGHMYTAYNLGRLSYTSFMWSGVEQRKSAWLGGGFAMLFLSTVEMFDGFSDGWGFSSGDMIANTLGAGLLIGQDYLWQQQRISLNFSYTKSIYADMRPDELGGSWKERWLKDYNGQTYWLSANISSFVKVGPDFPKWLNASVGYGANGMTGGHQNIPMENGQELQRYRQYYLSLGADFTRLYSNSPYYKTAAPLLNFYKMPCPTLEYNRVTKFRGHLFYPKN